MAESITVYFATNRNHYRVTKEEEKRVYVGKIAFGSDLSIFDGKALRFGKAEIEFTENEGHVKTVDVADERLQPNGKTGKTLFGSKKIYDALRIAVQDEQKNLLVVLHGYANSFESGLIGAAETARMLKRTNVFAFCWPSGEIPVGFNYGLARKNARVSGEAIGRAFDILLRFMGRLKADERCDKRIDILAHSMGAYALRNAIQAMDLDDRRNAWRHDEQKLDPKYAYASTRLFDDLCLVAADDDEDTLESSEGIAPLIPYVRSVTVYYSRRDLVLQYSDRVKFNPDRIGQTGPRNMSCISDKIVAVDVTEVLGQDDNLLDHWYHREPKAAVIVADIKNTLDDVTSEPHKLPRRHALDNSGRRFKLK